MIEEMRRDGSSSTNLTTIRYKRGFREIVYILIGNLGDAE
jgi:hypothetical protein